MKSEKIQAAMVTFDETFDCHDLEEMRRLVGLFASLIVFHRESAGTSPEAEVHVQQAMGHMRQAELSMELSHYAQMKGE